MYLEPDVEKHWSAYDQLWASDKTISRQLPSPAAGYSLLQLIISVWTCKTQDKYGALV